MTTVRGVPLLCQRTAMEGRVLRLRGSVEVQTAQLHPSVGTPMDVPLPRKTISAFMRGRRLLLLGIAGLLCLRRDRVRDLEEHHAEFEEHILQRRFFAGGEVAFRLVLQESEHVDALASAEDVDAGLLTRLGARAEG